MASKNPPKSAPKALLVAPRFEASTDNKMISTGMNSSGTAWKVTLTIFVGEMGVQNDGDYRYENNGQIDLPSSVKIGDQEYWLNVRSNRVKTKDGRNFVKGHNQISLTLKRPGSKETEPEKTETIPW